MVLVDSARGLGEKEGGRLRWPSRRKGEEKEGEPDPIVNFQIFSWPK